MNAVGQAPVPASAACSRGRGWPGSLAGFIGGPGRGYLEADPFALREKFARRTLRL